MKKMLDVLRYKICEHLDWRGVAKVALTNKSNYNALKNKVTEKKNEENLTKMKDIFGFYFESIRDMLGDENMRKAKYLPWEDKWMGNTDYIECYKPKEIPNTFSYGIDPHNRFFMFIKVKKIYYPHGRHPSTAKEKEGKKGVDSVIILFKRYTDAERVITHDCRLGNPLVDRPSNIVCETKEKNIKEFLSTGYVCYEETEWEPKMEMFLS